MTGRGSITLTRGLPASGKTTWARQWLTLGPQPRMRSNRDDLRASLFGQHGVLDHTAEQFITGMQRHAVREFLTGGGHVVVDDMNLRLKYARAWADLAASVGADFFVVDFPQPLDVLIARDAARAAAGERGVGEDVIRGLYARFRAPWPDVTATPVSGAAGGLYVPDPSLPPAWLVDVDGTLADNTARDPFAWHLVGQDGLIEPVARMVRALATDARIVVMSGRDEVCSDATRVWLAEHQIPMDALFMRKAGDMRRDAVVKRELFEAHVAPRWNVLGVIDDRQQVVDAWRAMGLMCAQVAPGDF